MTKKKRIEVLNDLVGRCLDEMVEVRKEREKADYDLEDRKQEVRDITNGLKEIALGQIEVSVWEDIDEYVALDLIRMVENVFDDVNDWTSPVSYEG